MSTAAQPRNRLPADRRKHPRSTPQTITGSCRRAAEWSGWSSPWFLGPVGSVALWAAFPPLGWWPLAWLAPAFWLRLVQLPELAGHRAWRAVWLSGFLYWALTLYGLVLAHWANYFGLVALAGYLGLWLVLFVALARTVHHRLGLPLVIAAPLVWIGIELARGYGPVGLSIATLAHSQVHWPRVIQVADLAGGFTLSGIMVACTAGLLEAALRRRAIGYLSLTATTLLLAGTLAYGTWRLGQPHVDPHVRPVRVALIQGSIDTTFDDQPDHSEKTFLEYYHLTLQAARAYPRLDLVVWPESMLPLPDTIVDGTSPVLEPGMSAADLTATQRTFQTTVRELARQVNEAQQTHRGGPAAATELLLGCSSWHFGDHAPRRYNAALVVAPDGTIRDRYFKMHPVMFGEYVPLGERFPWLYQLTPMPNGLTPGTRPLAFDTGGLRMAPSICFESTMPHLIREQTIALDQEGRDPQILVNLTNDGWFWGSSLLDLHLYCAVFRAVENRRPMLVAANTGFSAVIDGNGAIRSQGPRRAQGTLLAEVAPDPRHAPFQRLGMLPGWTCLVLALAGGLYAIARDRRAHRRPRLPPTPPSGE